MADEEKTIEQAEQTDAAINATATATTRAVESMGAELRDQVYSEENPLGPFKAPESVEIAGIRENVGFVPKWLIYLFILAILLSLVCWMRPGGPLS